MRTEGGRSRRRPALVVLAVAIPLVLCAQTIAGLLRPAPEGARTQPDVEPLQVGDLSLQPPRDPVGHPGPPYDQNVSETPTGRGDASQVWFSDGRWWAVLLDKTTGQLDVLAEAGVVDGPAVTAAPRRRR